MSVIRAALSPEEAAPILKTSRKGVYDLIHAGALRAKRQGRRWLIRPEWVEAYLEDDNARVTPMPVKDRRRLQALN